jgi:hypothetical protein
MDANANILIKLKIHLKQAQNVRESQTRKP